METPGGPKPDKTINEAIDLYNELNLISLDQRKEKLHSFQELLDKIAEQVPDDYIHYMWMHMVSILGICDYYDQGEADLRCMNYYHVKYPLQKILQTTVSIENDGKIEITGEIIFLFMNDHFTKKLGYRGLQLCHSNPRSTLIDYVEEAILISVSGE
jgi:PAS domain-containing protein